MTRYSDVEQVFRDPKTYSAAVAQAPLATLVPEAQQILLDGGHAPQPSMVSLDEPAHGRLRRPTTRAFTVKRVNHMIPAIRATAAQLLDAVGGREDFDLIAALAFPNISFRGPQSLWVRAGSHEAGGGGPGARRPGAAADRGRRR